MITPDHHTRRSRAAVVTALALACAACAGDSRPTAPVARPLVVGPAQTLQVPRVLQASASGGSGPVYWESSQPGVARVSASGLVTAVFPGPVTITARQSGHSATLAVTVTAARLDIVPSPVVVPLHLTYRLTATVRDADGAELRNVPVGWRTTDASIAAVDTLTGVVTARSPGTATITAAGGGTSSGVTVSVPATLGPALAFDVIGRAPNHACGLEAATGLAFCWGDNHAGALGSGENDGSDFPVLVWGGARRFRALSVSSYSTCALDVTGFAYCWGSNHGGWGPDDGGELGDGTREIRWVPTLVAGGLVRFTAISAGGGVTCGVEAETFVGYCWGKGGAIGDGTRAQRSMPTPVVREGGSGGARMRFSSVAASDGHACGIEVETALAYCWGANGTGQLGDGTQVDRLVPTPVGGDHRFTSIDAAGGHTCAIEAQTALAYCWGQNGYGQVGDGTTDARSLPTRVAGGGLTFERIDAGGEVACAVEARTGVAYCWGRNRSGALGDGTFTDRLVPTMVGGGSPRFGSVSATPWVTCGVEAGTGAGYCWGYGEPRPTPLYPPAASVRLTTGRGDP
jgi:alpha-tubulin suppressor-like RCC1 family protein